MVAKFEKLTAEVSVQPQSSLNLYLYTEIGSVGILEFQS